MHLHEEVFEAIGSEARGVDGFRVDALRRLVVDEDLRDDPPNPDYRPGQDPYNALEPVHTTDQPEVHGAIAEMRRTLDEDAETGQRLLIGELPASRRGDFPGETRKRTLLDRK